MVLPLVNRLVLWWASVGASVDLNFGTLVDGDAVGLGTAAVGACVGSCDPITTSCKIDPLMDKSLLDVKAPTHFQFELFQHFLHSIIRFSQIRELIIEN